MAATAQASHPFANGHIQGNVDVAPGVAVASGVLLGAALGCRLVISPGVCLGADVVVQARQGDLVLEPGVSLGSGVLVVGHGSIGQHTCIGANSTVINPALGASQVVAPNSLVGDPTQTASTGAASTGAAINGTPPSSPRPSSNGHAHDFSTHETAPAPQNGSPSHSPVYGKAQVNRLLATLFPQRQALNGASPEDRP